MRPQTGSDIVLTDCPITIDIELAGAGPYYLGDRIIGDLPDALLRHEFDNAFLVTSDRLYTRFGAPVERALADATVACNTLTVTEGEANKSWTGLAELCERLIAAGATKRSLILALGGGMVSNLVGLAAGMLFRGVRYVDIPTTLMAITDGVLSNKQAINGATGKNQFGLYHAPIFTWADVDFVRHEPVRQLRSAVVEAAKNGLISDPDWLETLAERVTPDLTAVIDDPLCFAEAMIRSKLPILRCDRTERQYGIILEYGHTVGHAVEWLSAGRLLHGEAVAIGMRAAARVGIALGVTPGEVLDCQEYVLRERLGCSLDLPATMGPKQVHEVIVVDNKRKSEGDGWFVLLEAVGTPYNPTGDYLTAVPEDLLIDVLKG
jgi:3-dehydroquinate synthase